MAGALACLLMGQVGLAHAQLRAPAAGGAASADTIAVDEDAEDADLGLTARPPAAGGDMPVAPAPTPRVIAADAPAGVPPKAAEPKVSTRPEEVPVPARTSPGALVAPDEAGVTSAEKNAQKNGGQDGANGAAKAEQADPGGEQGATEAEQPAGERGRPVAWKLDIEAPERLAKLLRSYLDLARFQQEAAKDATLAIRRSELRRLVISAPDQVRALLGGEGYFNPKISTRVGEEKPGEPVQVTIQVEPGPLTRVGGVQFVFEGELDARLSANDPLAQALSDKLEKDFPLSKGEVFRQAEWSSAKNGALARIRADGYPTAKWSGTSATVDAETNEASLYLVADSGPGFVFGDIRIEGLERQPASAIINLAPFTKGSVYSEKRLLDWQERIQKLNLFDDVFVATDLDPKQAGAAPVVVKVHEMQMQNATAGIGISTDTGPRISVEHLHRNIMATDWQAKSKVQLGKESLASLDLTSHPWPGRKRGLISGQASRSLDDQDSVLTSQQMRVGLLNEGERLERTDYVEWQHAKVVSKEGVVVSRATAVSGTSQWIFRNVDSQTQPTKGTTSLGMLTAGRSYATLSEEGYFTRAYAKVVGYLPLPWEWRAIGRFELGQVFARDAVSIPDTMLFRAGGDDSVRGYPYRSLGVEKNGAIIGGRSIATGSIELAHPLTKKLPALLGAVFLDVGDAAERFGNLQPNVGYGFGVRFLSPVGPLRLDLAYGTKVERWRMHFSVGVTL